jgi:hypothetical protein
MEDRTEREHQKGPERSWTRWGGPLLWVMVLVMTCLVALEYFLNGGTLT